ncbi:hypothetical protein ABVK25_007197 [Lepraria finkii]|uniref:Uncharacterized protein n=1 Tax=Lepraria finkii TaxID=1340010 RepID=A0ABR4B5Q2_9LECA
MTRATTAAALGSQRIRQRKLNTRNGLGIVREDELEPIDDELQRNVPRIDTGIEKAEEQEHHLQAALSASQAAAIGGKVAQIYIPTPDAVPSSIDYEELYPFEV